MSVNFVTRIEEGQDLFQFVVMEPKQLPKEGESYKPATLELVGLTTVHLAVDCAKGALGPHLGKHAELAQNGLTLGELLEFIGSEDFVLSDKENHHPLESAAQERLATLLKVQSGQLKWPAGDKSIEPVTVSLTAYHREWKIVALDQSETKISVTVNGDGGSSLAARKDDSDKEEEEPKPIFESHDVAGVAKLLATKKRVLVMLGAGASCAAGIPDFRTPGTGLYDNLDKYDLPEPEALFTLGYLRQHPEKFYRVCNEMKLWPGSYAPTHVHHFVKMLHDNGQLLRCFTQNIDCLERSANLPATHLVEAHGTFAGAFCIDCKKTHDTEWVKGHVERKTVPRCHKCEGIVKPSVVFFGEGLPQRFFKCLESDLDQADMVLVIGTSLAVQPFANIHCMVDKDVPRVLINMTRVGEFSITTIPQQEVDPSCRDVFLGGDCQASVKALCKELGKSEELEKLHQQGKKKIEDELAAKAKK